MNNRLFKKFWPTALASAAAIGGYCYCDYYEKFKSYAEARKQIRNLLSIDGETPNVWEYSNYVPVQWDNNWDKYVGF